MCTCKLARFTCLQESLSVVAHVRKELDVCMCTCAQAHRHTAHRHTGTHAHRHRPPVADLRQDEAEVLIVRQHIGRELLHHRQQLHALELARVVQVELLEDQVDPRL